MSPRSLALIAGLCLVAVVSAACGGDNEPITFGEGKLPASVPKGFPLPEGAVIGSTLVDRVNHRTEFAFTIRAEAAAVIQYYTLNLVGAGYVANRSEGDTLSWRIEFSRGEVRGTIVIQPGGTGLAAVVVGFNTV